MMTSETRPPSTPARFERLLDRHLAELMRRQLPKAPLKEPTGVRAAPTMTMSSLMEISCPCGLAAARPPHRAVIHDSPPEGCQ